VPVLTYLSEDDEDDEPELFSLFCSESEESSSDAFCNLNFLLEKNDIYDSLSQTIYSSPNSQ